MNPSWLVIDCDPPRDGSVVVHIRLARFWWARPSFWWYLLNHKQKHIDGGPDAS